MGAWDPRFGSPWGSGRQGSPGSHSNAQGSLGGIDGTWADGTPILPPSCTSSVLHLSSPARPARPSPALLVRPVPPTRIFRASHPCAGLDIPIPEPERCREMSCRKAFIIGNKTSPKLDGPSASFPHPGKGSKQHHFFVKNG